MEGVAMTLHARHACRGRLTVLATAACLCGLAPTAGRAGAEATPGQPVFDPLLADSSTACTPARGGPPQLLKVLIAARTETAPSQPVPMNAAGGTVPLSRHRSEMICRG
jgi:hypothetical protein